MTIIDFVLARIAEREAAAREATPAPWVAVGTRFYPPDSGDIMLTGYVDAWAIPGTVVEPSIEGADAQHIALSDPAYVLADCNAKRRIVELHPIYRGPRLLAVDRSGVDFACERCHATSSIDDESVIEALGACDTLRALASIHADHPDFNPAWKL